jgi:hypothetical protein
LRGSEQQWHATIDASNGSDFLVQSGLIFIGELKADGERSDAPPGIRRDWTILADWLGHKSGELNAVELKKLEGAWMAYLMIGLAPSHKLQPAFSFFSEQNHVVERRDRAPPEIMSVFGRLLATDDEIKIKRAADLARTEEQFRPLLAQLTGKKRSSWWRRQTPLVRTWIFASVVWSAFLFFYAFFFDPFDVGCWGGMRDEQNARFAVLILAPPIAGFVFYAYRRWVK